MAHRILIVASREPSREPTYELSKTMEANGYSAMICHACEDQASGVRADVTLDEDTSLSGYEGVVFFDDGHDDKLAINLAEKAGNKGLVRAGYSTEGCMILSKAGLLKDENICSGLPDEAYSGATRIDAPAVRSNKLVTATGDCVLGFSVVLVDALGGKVKKVVRGEESAADVAVIASLPSWPRWWPLARILAQEGLVLGVVAHEDVDLRESMAKTMIVMNPVVGKASARHNAPMPTSILVREGGVKEIRSLEAHGFRNVNSADAIEAVQSQETLEAIRLLFPQERTSLSQRGEVHRTRSGAKVVGRGDVALVSTGSREYRIVPADEAERLTPASRVPRGKRCQVLVSRGSNGWIPSVEGEIGQAAVDAAIVAHSRVEHHDDLNEVEVTVAKCHDCVAVEEVSALPCGCHDVSRSLAQNSDRERQRYLIERELGEEGIFLQPDGRMAMRNPTGLSLMSPEECTDQVSRRLMSALSREIDRIEAGEKADVWEERASRRHRHVLRCLLALLKELGMDKKASFSKFAYQYGKSVGGANFGLATDNLDIRSRVWPYAEEEGFLEGDGERGPNQFGLGQGEPGEDLLRNLQRYNPEYITHINDPNAYGVYYVWEEPRRSPYEWRRRFTDGTYPLSPHLKP